MGAVYRLAKQGDAVVAELEFPSLPNFDAVDERDVEMFVEGFDEAGDRSADAVLLPDVNFHPRAVGFEFVQKGDWSFGVLHAVEEIAGIFRFRRAMNRS